MYAGYEYQTSKGLKYGAVFCSRRSNICQLKFSFCFRHFSCYGLIGSIHNYIQMDREVCKMKAATSLHVFGEWLNTHTLQQSKGMVLRQGSVNSFMYNVWIGQVSSVPWASSTHWLLFESDLITLPFTYCMWTPRAPISHHSQNFVSPLANLSTHFSP